MIQAIEIKNFKSIEELKIEFGRVNVLIGENGCGKSAILEALTFAGAAESDRLDAEFLENRGIRVTSPQFMRSSFDKATVDKPIELKVEAGDENKEYIVSHSNETFGEWELNKERLITGLIDTAISIDDPQYETKVARTNNDLMETLVKLKIAIKNKEQELLAKRKAFEVLKASNNVHGQESDQECYEVAQNLIRLLQDINADSNILENLKASINILGRTLNEKLHVLKSFVIYAPQNKQLRSLTEEGSIRPVGIYGEGLFKLIREIHKTQPEAIEDIDKGLSLMGWYRAMDLDNKPAHPDDELYIQDKFLTEPFTQRSANEGFLYVLFYMAVMVSKDTPKVFAIDNIDAALNPKLCAKITSYLVELAKKYDKQIFLTTQNPATLDGLDLADDEQKLLIVSRKRGGQTTVKRFTHDKMPKNEHGEGIRLSEAMIRGYIGGIPKGF